MNKTNIEWALNPDGTPGYTWNPITGCLNSCDYCYARKLANGRLKSRYLAGNTAKAGPAAYQASRNDPFYPRFWPEKVREPYYILKSIGIFTCSMSDLFGIGVPVRWTRDILRTIAMSDQHRFYLLTKQPQNLLKFSPFPDNAQVGVTATDHKSWHNASYWLRQIEAKVKFCSFEPLLSRIDVAAPNPYYIPDWVIIGGQTNPTIQPKIEWVQEIVEAADRAGVPVFLKNNLKPLLPIMLQHELRQEVPQ